MSRKGIQLITNAGKSLAGLAILAALGCGGANEPTPAVEVGAVIVGNVPTGPLLVGNTVQLTATAVNTTGGTIASAAFTWSSADPAIATVSSGGAVTGVLPGSVVISATSGGKTGTATLDVRAGGTIGPAGGSLAAMNGVVVLEVPPGVLGSEVQFLIRPTPDLAQNPRVVPGTVIEIAPGGVPFFGVATLKLRYDPARVPSGLEPASLQLYRLNGSTWGLVGGAPVSPSAQQISGSLGTTGTYAVASTPVDHINLAGSSLDGALYSSQTTQLSAVLVDAYGNTLSGRTIAWSSTNSAAATVNGGLVTAVAPGSTTIAATADGKSAQTTIEVLPRPLADWSQATEWTGYQGDSTHRGYFAATLDPVTFIEKWTIALSSDGLNPVAIGPGTVYATPVAYFGTQKAFGLEVRNGAQRWSVDFGAIHGVHPPTYAAGTVYLTTSGHQDSFLYAFDAQTGTQRFRSSYGNQWSRYFAPVVIGSRVFMAGGGGDGMYSFDAIDGTEKWFAATNQYDQWTPAVSNGVVYAYTGEYSPKVIAVDAVSGAGLFEIPDPGFSWNGWSMNIAPVLGGSNDLLATQAGRLVSFDLSTRKIRWQMTDGFGGTVAVAGGVIYVVNAGRLEARGESDGNLLWSWLPTNATLRPTVVVTKNLAFATSDGRTYAVDLGSRREVWSYPAAGHLTPSTQGLLFIAGVDGKLRAISIR